MLSSDGRVVALNDMAAEMFGSAAYVVEGDPSRVLGDLTPVLRWLADDRETAVLRRRVEARRENDVPIVIDVSARRGEGADGRQALCILRELCEDRLAGEAQRHFDVAFEQAPIGMALFNTDGQYIRVNPSLCTLLGRSPDELIGRRDQEFTHPDDREADVEAAWRILRGELDRWQCEKRFLRPDGSVVWTIANLSFLRTADGHPLSWVGLFQDITAHKGEQAQLRELADRDPLTGVFNRRRLESELSLLIDEGREGALLVVDLDRFKDVNDTYGHDAGDVVLVTVASALRERMRGNDLISRIGGDEFALLLVDVSAAEAQALAKRVADTVAGQRFTFDRSAHVLASVGVSTFGISGALTPATVLAEADRAMYSAKSGGARVRLHGPRRRERVRGY